MWNEISYCCDCGGAWEASQAGLRCQECQRADDPAGDWLRLTAGPLPTSEPKIQGQVRTPDPAAAVALVGSAYAPGLAAAGVEADLRVLELGAGLGQLTCGFIRTYHPTLLVATDLFPSLAGELRKNLDAWGYPRPRGLVGVADANEPIALRPGAVNAIVGSAFLHHIVDYKRCLARLADLLDTPGVILFCEPIKDGYAYLLTLMKLLLALHNDPSHPLQLGETLVRVLGVQTENLSGRMRRQEDLAWLATLEDKHIFAPSKLEDVARECGLTFTSYAEPRDLRPLLLGQIKIRGASEADMAAVSDLFEQIIPDAIEDTYFADLRRVLCFTKTG